MSIRMYLDASTTHITPAEIKFMTGGVGICNYLAVVDYDEGAWIYVTHPQDLYEEDLEDMKRNLPNLLRLFLFAIEHHCAWIKLDADGDVLDKFPTFDW